MKCAFPTISVVHNTYCRMFIIGANGDYASTNCTKRAV